MNAIIENLRKQLVESSKVGTMQFEINKTKVLFFKSFNVIPCTTKGVQFEDKKGNYKEKKGK